jgi:hypothetical protein
LTAWFLVDHQAVTVPCGSRRSLLPGRQRECRACHDDEGPNGSRELVVRRQGSVLALAAKAKLATPTECFPKSICTGGAAGAFDALTARIVTGSATGVTNDFFISSSAVVVADNATEGRLTKKPRKTTGFDGS